MLVKVCACLAVATAVAAVEYDVVVYGSTPAGIAAATAAGQLGMNVAVYGTFNRSSLRNTAASGGVDVTIRRCGADNRL